MAGNNPIHYSKTQRIVLLIDLTPLLHLRNPNSYLTSVLSAVKTLLSFPPLSLSLFSFKLFFSSLSPLLSSSTLRNITPNSLSFDRPTETLILLSKTLDSIGDLAKVSGLSSVSKVSNTSSSVAQVIHDYAWDLCGNDDANSVSRGGLVDVVRTNLVVLFSPICQSFNGLCEFMGDDMINKWDDNDVFCNKFRRVFGYVRDAFVSRDIHFSWVDVRYESDNDNSSKSCKLDHEYGRLLVLFRNGVKGLGWGFCSSDSIVLGSALISFGLIYPMIGVSSIYCDVGYDKCMKILGQLNLEILDVSGKPLVCKYCDLQLVDPKTLSGRKLNDFSLSLEPRKDGGEMDHHVSGIWKRLGNEVVKIDVKALCQHSELMNFEEQISDVMLVEELLIDSKKNKEESSQEFFTDRVLDLLSAESSKSIKAKSPPLWQIFLSFLYRRGYWALVSLSNVDGSTTMSVLKPFTVHSALLCILKNNSVFQYDAQSGLSSLTLGQCSSDTRDKINRLNVGMDSVSGMIGNDGRRKHKKHRHNYKDLSWSSFCKAAFEHCEMELEEACFSSGCEASKKVKFLKCWMKQVVKNSPSFQSKSDLLKSQEKSVGRLCNSHQESGQPLAFPVVVNEAHQREEVTPSLSEAAEAFFNNLSERIQHGIESGVDMLAFAQRVVHSCIYWISRKLGPHTNEDDGASVELSNSSCSRGTLVGEVIKILLIEPKVLAGKYKENDLSSKAPDSNSSIMSSENKIREYELQILVRMEILQSEIAVGIRESTKQKLVKQICSLLELIQCSMDDGFFGDFNLNDYVGKIISARYKQNLPGIVHSIYKQMDLLLFDDEDESPNLLLNSEESNQSWRIGNNGQGSEPNSTEDSFSGPSRDYEQTQTETCDERKLVEAQERRARALRLSSFTRRSMPELQRVWAPKLPKQSKSKSEYNRRSKRKKGRESYDMVCETPMSGAKKCLFPSECNIGDQIQEASFTGTTKKALFQDDPVSS